MTCGCCGGSYADLEFTHSFRDSRPDMDYCRACHDWGCDLETCDVPTKPKTPSTPARGICSVCLGEEFLDEHKMLIEHGILGQPLCLGSRRKPRVITKKGDDMGYDSTVTGELTIKPAIDPKGTIFDPEDDLAVIVIRRTGGTEDTVAVINGQITVVPGDSWSIAEYYSDEPCRGAGELDQTVDALIELAKGKGAVVNGHLRICGEEEGDIWRIRVENNNLNSERPKLVWPNGDEEHL